MANKDDVENLLIELELPFERLDDELWVVVNDADQGENLVVYLADSVLTIRVKVFDLPAEPSAALYRRLLELNASEVVHGGFGIESNNVVLTGALEVENLDRNEFQALVDSFTLALSSHYSELTALLH
ncbi:MAG: hypothetical protein ACJAYU_003701 [Bradymonadia bacterium]|jgi:hypothetical protein